MKIGEGPELTLRAFGVCTVHRQKADTVPYEAASGPEIGADFGRCCQPRMYAA